MEYVIAWLILALLVGAFGDTRKIGFGAAFAWSLLLSPLVGFIIAVSSTSKDQMRRDMEAAKIQKKQLEAMEAIKAPASVADDLERLRAMLDAGTLTAEEYESAKRKALGIV